jgi:hypothetical protein
MENRKKNQIEFCKTANYLFDGEWRKLDFVPQIIEEINIKSICESDDGIERYFKCVDQENETGNEEFFLLILREEMDVTYDEQMADMIEDYSGWDSESKALEEAFNRGIDYQKLIYKNKQKFLTKRKS